MNDLPPTTRKLVELQAEVNNLRNVVARLREWSDQLDDTDRAGLYEILDATPATA